MCAKYASPITLLKWHMHPDLLIKFFLSCMCVIVCLLTCPCFILQIFHEFIKLQFDVCLRVVSYHEIRVHTQYQRYRQSNRNKLAGLNVHIESCTAVHAAARQRLHR